MDYLITEAVALKAAREEEDARKSAEKEQERENWKKESKEKLKKMFNG